MYLAARTFTPFPIPIRNPVNSITRIVVEPMAPSASAHENFPTTTISDILKHTCNKFNKIRGMLKRNTRLPSEHDVISIVSIHIFIFIILITKSLYNISI